MGTCEDEDLSYLIASCTNINADDCRHIGMMIDAARARRAANRAAERCEYQAISLQISNVMSRNKNV